MKFLQLNHFETNFSLPLIRYLSQMSAKNTAAVCQFTATSNKEVNFKIVTRLVSEAAEKAKVIFLPEACDYVGTDITETKQLAEPLDGKLMSQYRLLAQRNNVWLSIGGFHEVQQVNGEDTMHNTHVLINSEGVITGTYRKVHLFDVSLPESNINLQESSYITAGNQIGAPVSTPIGSVGLMICYDLRFPELSLILRKNGGDVLTFPSAFTVTTGEAHWKTLLKSRAIENQCYVIAAAQYGVHNQKRISFGNSLIVDPWGNIIAECPAYSKERATDESIAYANIDVEFLKGVRQKMPVLNHRRDDLYRLALNVNKHVNNVPNFMFSDKHIHCHILPRKVGDFEHNDNIYLELAKHDRDHEKPIRDIEEMTTEANMLKKLVAQ